MIIKWKKSAFTVILSSALLTQGYAAFAAEASASSGAAVHNEASYKLTDQPDVEIKTVLNEKVTDGTRLGVVIRLSNNASKPVRVPDYELRFRTDEGVEYTLQPSASNPKSVQPKTKQELSYMASIDRIDTVNIKEIGWVDVDLYVYPKQETAVLNVPVTTEPWQGSGTVFKDASAMKKWGESFMIPSLQSPLKYTPVSITNDVSGQTPTALIQLLVENETASRETVPDFVIDAKSDKKVFSGKRVEQGPVTVEPGDKKYIHYAIPTDLDTQLISLNLLTQEKFNRGEGSAAAPVQYTVGRLNVILPSSNPIESMAAAIYQMGNPLKFDSMNPIVSPDMDVSLVELNVHENEGEGYKTAIAKFKLMNKGDSPLAIPGFQAELASKDGFAYTGTRQNITTQKVMPNTAFALSYSFILPPSETKDSLILKLQDTVSAAPYKTTISASRVALKEALPQPDQISMYPFDMKIMDWRISSSFTAQRTYGYKLKLWLDIQRPDQVIIDSNFSKLHFELLDSAGRVISAKALNFTGPNRLMSGENNIMFDSTTEQMEYPVTVNVYESITTPNGDAKRLVATFKQ